MHFKHAVSLLPLSNVKLIWKRVTASRIAIIYIVFSILNCIIQLVFQAHAFTINKQAADFLSGLIYAGNASLPGFFVFGSGSQLYFCDHVPTTLSTESCMLVWNGTISAATGASRLSVLRKTSTIPSTDPITIVERGVHTTNSRAFDLFKAKRFLPRPQVDLVDYRPVTTNGSTGVSLQGFGSTGIVTLDSKCLVALNWPVQTLDNTKREDVAFLMFQIWVLGMSLVAVLNESIPHMIATVLTHLSATAWGGFQIYNTNAFHADFKRLTTDGVCQINLLPKYWTSRAHAEIPSLAFNILALLVSSFLSFRLIKLFGWQTFKRVGASRTINRIYKLVLTLSVVIQLSLFFVVAAVALWLDQLFHGAIAIMATQSNTYQAFLMVVIVMLIPWLLTGWFAARRELKVPMLIFLVLSALYLVGFCLMFDSGTFRWTFVQWGFFGAMASLSAFLDLVGFVVGIMCRLNFDKGLVQYLKAEEPLRECSFIQPVEDGENPFDEKFDFPSTHHPIPTFSDTLGSNHGGSLVSQLRFQKGPRFFNQSAAPFDLRVDIESVTRPSAAHLTPETDTDSVRPLTRKGSQNSTSSDASSAASGGRSRWVIE